MGATPIGATPSGATAMGDPTMGAGARIGICSVRVSPGSLGNTTVKFWPWYSYHTQKPVSGGAPEPEPGGADAAAAPSEAQAVLACGWLMGMTPITGTTWGLCPCTVTLAGGLWAQAPNKAATTRHSSRRGQAP